MSPASRPRASARLRVEPLEARVTPATLALVEPPGEFRTPGGIISREVAVDAAGNRYVAGEFRGTADVDPGPGVTLLTSSGPTVADVFVTKIDPAGRVVYARSFGNGTSSTEIFDLDVDGAGNAYLVGRLVNTVDFGGGPVGTPANPGSNVRLFVAKLDAAGGHVYSRAYASPDTSGEAAEVAADGAGNTYVAGRFLNTEDFGGGPLTAVGAADGFVLKLDAAGGFVYARQFDGTGFVSGEGVAVDAAGNAYVVGQFEGTANFGGVSLTSAVGPSGYAVKLDPAGGLVYARVVGTPVAGGTVIPSAVAVDVAGGVFVGGLVIGAAEFGGGPVGANNWAAFLVKLDPAGTFASVRTVDTADRDTVDSVAVDRAGNASFTVRSFDSGSSNRQRARLFRLAAGGELASAAFDAGSADVRLSSVALDPSGRAVVAASFSSAIDLDPGPGVIGRTPSPGALFEGALVLDRLTASVAATADAAEGGAPGRFTATLTPTFQTRTVRYAVSGTATAGVDYAALSGTVTFAPGQGTATIDVSALADQLREGLETLTLTLLPDDTYARGAAAATLGIIDTTRTARPGGTAVGGPNGTAALVDPDGTARLTVTAFPGYAGPVRVAVGDVDGDGTADLIVGTAAGAAHVRAFSGVDGAELASFFAFDGFAGGVNVGAADLDGDGVAEILVGAATGASHVKAFGARGQSVLRSFLAFDGYAGGVTVAGGDLDGDGRDDVVVGTAALAGHVKAFSGANDAVLASFLTGDPAGVFVAAGDLDGDGRTDIATGTAVAVAVVRVFAAAGGRVAVLFPYGGFAGGTFVAAPDLDGDGRSELLVGTGPGARAHVKSFGFPSFEGLDSFFAFDPGFVGGVSVA